MNKLLSLALAGLVVSQLHGCAAVVVGGAATGAAIATDRRTAGVFVGDQEIELRAQNRLNETFPQKNLRISTTSYNRQVLLTGQVPDEVTRTRAGEIAKEVPDVRAVYNELAVSGVASYTSHTNDTAITSKVKSRLLRDETAPGLRVKVVTESAVVYLMGLVSRAEAKAATEIARTTSGVTKVVVLFEYVD